jgi:hypothetical protein
VAAEPDLTFRFRAESRIIYARALVNLLRRARSGDDDFTFGPLMLAALQDQGLVISGPSVSGWVDDFLKQVPGIYRADE